MSNCFFCNAEISSTKKYQSAIPSSNERGWEWVDGCQECVRKNYALEELRQIRTGTGKTLYWDSSTKRNTVSDPAKLFLDCV